jgi:hypothetical protein
MRILYVNGKPREFNVTDRERALPIEPEYSIKEKIDFTHACIVIGFFGLTYALPQDDMNNYYRLGIATASAVIYGIREISYHLGPEEIRRL